MGQYYYIVNLDKREFLHAHKFGDGLKLREFGASGGGTMYALALLLADGNGRGGGDFPSKSPLIGSWAGDRIVIAGDYADGGKFGLPADTNAHDAADNEFVDISYEVIRVICNDEQEAADMARRMWRIPDDCPDWFRPHIEKALAAESDKSNG